jgi:hypothetical protein
MIQELTVPQFSNKLVRESALERLRRYSIEGKRIYLIDLIPLIEMIWAGDRARVAPTQIEFFYRYANWHLGHINTMAGYLLLKSTDATNFTAPYLVSRPDMARLKKIRECIVPVRIGETRNDYGDMVINRIMSACREILSMSVAKYSREFQHIYRPREVDVYLDIMKSFQTYRSHLGNLADHSRWIEPFEVEVQERRAS